MAGSPKKRARLAGALALMGEEMPEPKGWSPPHAPRPSRKGVAPPDYSKPTARPDAPEKPSEFETILGGVRADDLDSESQAQFYDLRKLAFQFAQEVMELPLVPTDKNFTKILSVKQAIATALLTATVRVRPGDLRDKDEDGVSSLLEQVKAAGGPLTAEEMLS